VRKWKPRQVQAVPRDDGGAFQERYVKDGLFSKGGFAPADPEVLRFEPVAAPLMVRSPAYITGM